MRGNAPSPLLQTIGKAYEEAHRVTRIEFAQRMEVQPAIIRAVAEGIG